MRTVRMLVTAAGPNGTWQAQKIAVLPNELAASFVDGGYAVYLDAEATGPFESDEQAAEKRTLLLVREPADPVRSEHYTRVKGTVADELEAESIPVSVPNADAHLVSVEPVEENTATEVVSVAATTVEQKRGEKAAEAVPSVVSVEEQNVSPAKEQKAIFVEEQEALPVEAEDPYSVTPVGVGEEIPAKEIVSEGKPKATPVDLNPSFRGVPHTRKQ